MSDNQDPADCPHGVQYRKRMHLCCACMEEEIGLLEQRVDITEIERDEARSVGDTLERQHQLAVDDANEARAEVARLREALTEVQQWRHHAVGLAPMPKTDAGTLGNRISAALAPKETP